MQKELLERIEVESEKSRVEFDLSSNIDSTPHDDFKLNRNVMIRDLSSLKSDLNLLIANSENLLEGLKCIQKVY